SPLSSHYLHKPPQTLLDTQGTPLSKTRQLPKAYRYQNNQLIQYNGSETLTAFAFTQPTREQTAPKKANGPAVRQIAPSRRHSDRKTEELGLGYDWKLRPNAGKSKSRPNPKERSLCMVPENQGTPPDKAARGLLFTICKRVAL